MRSRRQQMARLENLARPAIEKQQQNIRKTAQQVWEEFHQKGLTHASNLSLLIRFGDPQEGEPLERLWERCLASKAPELGHALAEVKEFKCNPFDNPVHARSIGYVFRKNVLPKLRVPGGNDPERLVALISKIPRSLLCVAYADLTFSALSSVSLGPSFKPLLNWYKSTRNYVPWPLLPHDALYQQGDEEEFELLLRDAATKQPSMRISEFQSPVRNRGPAR
jgi:hypothetical protein